MRKEEKQGQTYHFVSEDEFKQKINDGFFAEWKTYNTKFGTWYYGTALDDLKNADDKTIIILTPNGYRDMVNLLPEKPKAIYVYSNNATIEERLSERGDDKREAKRRIESDNIDFKGVENEVDKIFYNNTGTDIDDIVKKIIEYLEE